MAIVKIVYNRIVLDEMVPRVSYCRVDGGYEFLISDKMRNQFTSLESEMWHQYHSLVAEFNQIDSDEFVFGCEVHKNSWLM